MTAPFATQLNSERDPPELATIRTDGGRMIIRNLLAAVALTVIPIVATPVAATPMTDAEKWDAFESCTTEYVDRGMGDAGAASSYCYVKIFGSEQSGGGYSEHDQPGPVRPCYGGDCNPVY